MKIEKIIKKKSNLYQILLSDNTSLSFYDDTIINYNLLIKKEFDDKKLQEMLKYNNEIDAYYKALTYIKSKLRTKKEITNKLNKLRYPHDTIKNVIDKLEKQKYLNDDLYIKSYIADQVNLSLKGPNKIMYELEKLGFKRELIILYLENYDNNLWQERCQKIIAKKIKNNHNYSKKILQNKLKIELTNLGYNQELFNNLVNNISYEDDDIILEKEIKKAIRKYSSKYNGKDLETKVKMYLYTKGFNYNIDLNKYL